jgi:hypothetical protein
MGKIAHEFSKILSFFFMTKGNCKESGEATIENRYIIAFPMAFTSRAIRSA